MKTILLTGGCGFIGSHLADMYLSEGFEVVVVDDFSTGREENLPDGCTLYRMDIQDPGLNAVFEKHRPSIVNHHAAQINVRVSVEDPILDARVNILGMLNILGCCRKFPPDFITFASSGGAIYGDDVARPTPEEARSHPASPYGIAKLAGELYLDSLIRKHGIPFAALRYGNVYGPRQSHEGEAGVIAIFYNNLLAGGIPTINGDGEQTRDYVYVGDVVKMNRKVSLERIEGIYNVGTGSGTGVNELAGLILSTLDLSETELPHGPAKPGEQLHSVLDSRKASMILGEDFTWTKLGEGLQTTCDYFKEAVCK